MKYYATMEEVKSGEVSPDELEVRTKLRHELTEGIENHDCHASPEDGCFACSEWDSLKEEEASLIKRGLCFNRYGTCEGDKLCFCI